MVGSLLETLCLAAFIVLVSVPALYGLHMYVLLALAQRRRERVRAAQRATIEQCQRFTPEEAWPRVTTQIPIYNELEVARRIIEAAARMDYPAGRHQVQVLDDSTDETRDLIYRCAAELRRQGHDIQVVRRSTRAQYKAGALQHGLKSATGEFIAIFDADFVPDRAFLRRLIPLIFQDPRVGCVQGRWGHLNARESWITQGLALGLDMHFAIEQPARSWNGLLLNFNGTAGIWRKATILDPRVGGWDGDTITEDLDLSYRAQIAGWRIQYCVDEVCPAELPADVDALKTQQRRWATGSIQTARKILPLVWRSPLTLPQKLEATAHLTQYSISVVMLVVALAGRLLPAAISPERFPRWLDWAALPFLLAAVAPAIAYVYGRWVLGGGLTSPLTVLKLMVLGFGLAVNNGIAVLVGLFQRGGEFVRTPKSGSVGQRRGGRYAALRSRLWIVEIALGASCFAQWLYFLRIDGVGGLYLLLYAIGLAALGWGSRPRPAPRAAAAQRQPDTATALDARVEPAL